MEFPIYIDDREAGLLRMEKCGPYTVFRGEMEDVGRLVRLFLYGEKGDMYLGIPEPEEGKLVLLRRMTAWEMRAFPKKAEYAAERRRRRGEPQPDSREEKKNRSHVLWQGGKPYFF